MQNDEDLDINITKTNVSLTNNSNMHRRVINYDKTINKIKATTSNMNCCYKKVCLRKGREPNVSDYRSVCRS